MSRPEHRFSHWAIKLLDVVLTKPCFYTAVDTGTALLKTGSQEEVRRARAAWEAHRRYMGIMPHVPDLWIYQRPILAMCELKIGRNDTTVSQNVSIELIREQNIMVRICYTIPEVFEFLKRADFRLHGNAANLAKLIDERYQAARREANEKTVTPRRSPGLKGGRMPEDRVPF